ncbi:MAG: DNA-directed RNA polymerase subunit beta', partial [Candidatus Pacebacteria bacterium CG10_big_fil_rev_8_21_14_0_10_45_6]
TPVLSQEIADANISPVFVRSPLACQAIKGMCSQCYGWDFSTHDMVQLGVPVGIVAAQSIGEPGTQLTMRVKHSGGILGLDVTQGLPRVEELLEARIPKNQALIAEVAGKVKIKTKDDETIITIGTTDKVEYTISSRTPIIVEDGDLVHIGQQLTAGSINLREMLQLQGLLPVQQHLVREVQRVYESQGIPIHDKHFEVIVRKMSDKLQIEASGDTSFLAGEIAQRSRFSQINEETIAAGGEPATAKVLFLGITRSSLYTDSWLSAASFQHTKHILTDAASIGAVDELQGLKENVIIGRLIPTSEERARI